MILIDTNVVSELSRLKPDTAVVSWMQRFEPLLVLPTIVIAEIRHGCALMPAGQRRDLVTAFCDALKVQFAGRIYSFDIAAADRYGDVQALGRAADRPMAIADAQIAAIALALGFDLATRNTADFTHLPLKLINPWTA